MIYSPDGSSKSFPYPRAFLRPTVGLALFLLSFTFTLNAAETETNLSPLLHYRSTDTAEYWQVAGPFFEFKHEAKPEAEMLMAMPRPLFSRFKDPVAKARGWDAVWPLAASRTRPDGHYSYALNFLHTRKPEGFARKQSRWWLWPFFFTGQDQHGTAYFAIFPIGGTIADFGLADRATFALFPLYAKSERGEMTQHSVLWPIFSRGQSPTTQKWRIFPLYGINQDENTRRRFLAWPLLHLTRVETPRLEGGGFFIFPLYGDLRQRDREGELQTRSRTVLWPFFSYEYSPLHKQIHLPWPFYQYRKAEEPLDAGVKRYFWPLYGRHRRPESDYRFILWPFLHHRTMTGAKQRTVIHRLDPVWRKTRRINRDTEETEFVSRSLWPLFRWQIDNNRHDLRILNLMPGANLPVIERNYAPLWRIYRYRAADQKTKHRLLWGLWEYSKNEKKTEHRLFPIFNYQKKNEGKQRFSIFTGLLEFSRQPEINETSTRLLWFLDF